MPAELCSVNARHEGPVRQGLQRGRRGQQEGEEYELHDDTHYRRPRRHKIYHQKNGLGGRAPFIQYIAVLRLRLTARSIANFRRIQKQYRRIFALWIV